MTYICSFLSLFSSFLYSRDVCSIHGALDVSTPAPPAQSQVSSIQEKTRDGITSMPREESSSAEEAAQPYDNLTVEDDAELANVSSTVSPTPTPELHDNISSTVPPTPTPEPEEDLLSFEEWKKKKEEDAKNEVPG